MMLARPEAPAVRGWGDRLAALPRLRRWAAAASVGWAVVVIGYAVGFARVAAGSGAGSMAFLDAMFFMVALVLPLVLVWLAAWLAEELARQREIIAALAEVTPPMIGALEATRQSLASHAPVSLDAIGGAVEEALIRTRGPDLASPLARVLAGQARIELALQKLAGKAPSPMPTAAVPRAAAAAPTPAVAEPAAPMAESPELSAGEEAVEAPRWDALVRALNFPRDADDKEGFRALRSALRHQGLAQLLQAAEDVLNLLSQEGVFVDELPMAPVDVGAWRRFMAGTRGAEVAAVGGIHDRNALDLAGKLMQADTIFRDTALFFQRRFDAVLGEFAAEASDAELAELVETRSGRAFMLLARLRGSLD